eukprot:9165847-Alexandrium_andersonii.AAC.1
MGTAKKRSQRFLAEARAVKAGLSQLTVWQVLQREKQHQRNRVKKLDAALQGAQEGRALPRDEETQWPGGTWQCGVRGGKNAPSEFCQSLEGRG